MTSFGDGKLEIVSENQINFDAQLGLAVFGNYVEK